MIQNINNKIICNPSSIEDVESISHIAYLKQYNNIIFDLVDLTRVEREKNSSCMSIMLGLLIEMMKNACLFMLLSLTVSLKLLRFLLHFDRFLEHFGAHRLCQCWSDTVASLRLLLPNHNFLLNHTTAGWGIFNSTFCFLNIV